MNSETHCENDLPAAPSFMERYCAYTPVTSDASTDYIMPHSSDPDWEVIKFDGMTIGRKRTGNPMVIINPDKQNLLEGREWTILEREIKLKPIPDTDCRDLLSQLPSTIECISLAKVRPAASHQRFIRTENGGICIKTGIDHSGKSEIKYKLPAHGTQTNHLVRNEYKKAFTLNDLTTVLSEMGADPSQAPLLYEYIQSDTLFGDNQPLPITPAFTRNRVLNTYVTQDSGCIMSVIADHCVAEDGRKPLNQLELEIDGWIGDTDREITLEEIEQEFTRFTTFLSTHYEERGVTLLPDTTTKYEWISLLQ